MIKSDEPASGKFFSYERVFTYGSLQFCGHIEDYFALHSRDLLMFIVQPRIGAQTNLLRTYHEGVMVQEKTVRSSQNVVLYYLFWYVNHLRAVLNFCPKRARTLILGGHPVIFFGMALLKRMRPLVYAYWIGDYFPSEHPVIRLFERLKKYYHGRVSYAFYLSDAINKVMNGTVVDSPTQRTVMWGLKPFPAVSAPPLSPFSLLFVGLIRPGQGLEALFNFLNAHPEYRLTVIGVCPPVFYAELQHLLEQYGLKERVFFPNRFYAESELLEVARGCHVGIALYDTSAGNFTHYADPGKVKAYAEMHLPVLMTRISDIVPFVERFGSGEVIDRVDQIGDALDLIRQHYPLYQAGVELFNAHFEYERYYGASFKAMEESWT